MPVKGLSSQTFVVLFAEAPDISELQSLLTEFNILKEAPAADDWVFGGPSLIVEYLLAVNGLVSIDVIDREWPDHMGDPKNEISMFAAWSMGWFGPFTYPHGLLRATQQSWRWAEAKVAAHSHKAFVRLRMSYIFGAGKEVKCLPEDYQPLPELEFLTALASTLLQHPKALCYFNPNGEVLLPKEKMDDDVVFARTHRFPPLNIWTNVRLFNFDAQWLFMDTVGNWQLDVPDQEIAFPKDRCSPQEIDRWLRNTTLYQIRNGRPIKEGDTIDGPGNIRFQNKVFDKGLTAPPRRVLRWLPCGFADIPAGLLQ